MPRYDEWLTAFWPAGPIERPSLPRSRHKAEAGERKAQKLWHVKRKSEDNIDKYCARALVARSDKHVSLSKLRCPIHPHFGPRIAPPPKLLVPRRPSYKQIPQTLTISFNVCTASSRYGQRKPLSSPHNSLPELTWPPSASAPPSATASLFGAVITLTLRTRD